MTFFGFSSDLVARPARRAGRLRPARGRGRASMLLTAPAPISGGEGVLAILALGAQSSSSSVEELMLLQGW